MAFIEVSRGNAGEFNVSASITKTKNGQVIRFGLGDEARKEAFPDAGKLAVDFGYGVDFGKILLRPSMNGYAISGKGKTKSISLLLSKAGIESDNMSPEVVKHEINSKKGQMIVTMPQSVVTSWKLNSFGKRRAVLADESDDLNGKFDES